MAAALCWPSSHGVERRANCWETVGGDFLVDIMVCWPNRSPCARIGESPHDIIKIGSVIDEGRYDDEAGPLLTQICGNAIKT